MPAPAAAEDLEQRWLRTLYRPGVPQLTVRAVVTGMLLGALMCLSNLYVVRRRKPAEADATVTPVASGVIAGESLMGVAIAIALAVFAR